LDTAFPSVVTFDTESVAVDIEVQKRRIAPFVSPLVEGKVIEELGNETVEFKPAYLKPKTPLTPEKSLQRALGEQIGGAPEMTAGQRMQLRAARVLADHYDIIVRRLEVMASEALRLGRVTVSGEGYATKIVNYGRNAGLTIVLEVGLKWSDAGSNPAKDIEEAAESVHKLEGAAITDIVMDPDAWAVFKENANVQKLLTLAGGLYPQLTGVNAINLGPATFADVEGAKFVGVFGTFNLWVYSDWYIDPADGVEKPILPSGTVIGIAKNQIDGVRAHGAILDERAGLQALEIFPKSWVIEDPSVRILMCQSAPLVVPKRPNASFSISVL
jgi:hypothetical protein